MRHLLLLLQHTQSFLPNIFDSYLGDGAGVYKGFLDVDIMNSNEDEVPGGAPEEDKSTDLIPNTVDENHWQSKTHQLKMQEQLSERL